jgi:hypothetical protein
MTKRSRTALIGGVLIGALLLMGARFPTKATPAHFANGVCTTVNEWATATKSGSTELDTKIAAAKNLREVRDLLAAYLGTTAHETTVALDGIDEAGTPSTPKGAEASKVLKESFKQIRSALRDFQNQAEDMSIKQKAKALKQLKALNTRVGVEFGSFSKALSKLAKLDPNHKLEKAFKANAVCQSL